MNISHNAKKRNAVRNVSLSLLFASVCIYLHSSLNTKVFCLSSHNKTWASDRSQDASDRYNHPSKLIISQAQI